MEAANRFVVSNADRAQASLVLNEVANRNPAHHFNVKRREQV